MISFYLNYCAIQTGLLIILHFVLDYRTVRNFRVGDTVCWYRKGIAWNYLQYDKFHNGRGEKKLTRLKIGV